MPANVLKRVQLGAETIWGTPVPATAKLMGVMDATITIVNDAPAIEEVGLAVASRQIQRSTSAEGSIQTAATYEDLPYLLEMVFGAVTPAGAGPYTRVYEAPGAAFVAPAIKTIEAGEAGAGYRIEGAIGNELTIRAEAGNQYEAELGILGQAVGTVTLADLAERSTEIVRAADMTVFMDAIGGTIGTTAVPATLIEFSLSVNPSRHLKQFVGSVSPGGHGQALWEIGLELTLEFNAAAKAMVDALIPGAVQRQIRLKAESGTKSVTIDFAGGLAENVELWGDRDGNMTVQLTFMGLYNAALGTALAIEVVNGIGVLP